MAKKPSQSSENHCKGSPVLPSWLFMGCSLCDRWRADLLRDKDDYARLELKAEGKVNNQIQVDWLWIGKNPNVPKGQQSRKYEAIRVADNAVSILFHSWAR